MKNRLDYFPAGYFVYGLLRDLDHFSVFLLGCLHTSFNIHACQKQHACQEEYDQGDNGKPAVAGEHIDQAEHRRPDNRIKLLGYTEETIKLSGFTFRHQLPNKRAAESLAASLDGRDSQPEQDEMPFLRHEVAHDGDEGIDRQGYIDRFFYAQLPG